MGEDGPFAPEWYHSEFGDSSILGQATGPYPFPKDETWELANFLPVETPDYLSRFSTDCGIEYLRDYPRLEPNYGSVSKLEAGAISNNFSDLGVPFLDVDGRHQRASASPGHSGSWELDPTAGAGSWALHSVEASQHRANTATSRLNLDRKPVCKQCHRMFSTGYELEEHARMFNHRSYVCTEPGCDKSYCRRDVLLRHGATHKSSDFHCSFCLKANRKRSFKRKDHLAQHIRNRHLHTSSAGSSSDSEAVHHKGATNTEDSCCSGSEDSIEVSPTLSTSPGNADLI